MEFSLDKSYVETFRNKPSPFGFNGLGELVYMRTYSRLMENGQKEEWVDTICRVVNGLYSYQKRYFPGEWDEEKAQASAKKTFSKMVTLKMLPGGRVLWTAGTSVPEKTGMCLYNCSYISTIDIDKSPEDAAYPFKYLMDLMMLGVGVGFDVFGEGKIKVKKPRKDRKIVFEVQDTREGWVESLGILLLSYFKEGETQVEFDYSRIREKGLPLKSFGGISSGAGPLKSLHTSIKHVLDAAGDKDITCKDITDIMNLIGVCVVAGNCRRCLPEGTKVFTNKGLKSIETLKIGDMVITPGGEKKVTNVMNQGIQKLVEVVTECGSLWCTAKHKLYTKNNKTKEYTEGIPASELKPGMKLRCCTEAINGEGSWLPKFKDLVPKIVDEGTAWVLGVFQIIGTVDKDKIRMNIFDSILPLLPTIVKEMDRITPGSYGSIKYDDTIEIAELVWYNPEVVLYYNEYIKNIPHIMSTASLEAKKAYISGMVDIKMRDTLSLTDTDIFKTNNNRLANDVRSIILSTGVRCKVIKETYYEVIPCISMLYRVANYCKLSTFSNGNIAKDLLYTSKQKDSYSNKVISVNYSNIEESTWDITVEEEHKFYANGYLVSNSAEIAGGSIHNDDFIELKNYEKNPEREAHGWASNNSVFADIGNDYKRVSSLMTSGGEPGIFWSQNAKQYSRMCDVADHKDNKFVFTNPCGEITLESGEMCNLVEVFIARQANKREFRETLKEAYICAKTVTLLTVHWSKTDEIIKRNRRLGISVSGVAQFLGSHSLDTLRDWLEDGYKYLQTLDKSFSELFQIPVSIKLTCIKPSGTTSLLAGATPGLHYPTSQYYIRRIRVAKGDKLMNFVESVGYPYESCAIGTDNYVVEIPVFVGEGVKCNANMYEQLMITAFMQRYWADNQVSSTVTFKKEEAPLIAGALDYFQYFLKSISFLPECTDAYKQMPYENITKEEYERRFKELRRVKKRKIESITPDSEEQDPMLFCDNVSCVKL